MVSVKLADFLREVSNWTWEEFAKAEKNKNFTTNQAIIFALVRACAMQKMDAIRIALNRLDGKLKTPIKIEMPKVYYLFPNATEVEQGDVSTEAKKLNASEGHSEAVDMSVETLHSIAQDVIEMDGDNVIDEGDLPTMSLRETLTKMSDYPRELPEAIVERALQIEQAIRNRTPMPVENPRVKSVMAAHLLIMAQSRHMDAIGEVFDQIDGKLAETIQVLGEDIYITSYSRTAPSGAIKNSDGVLQLEATDSQNMWASKLGKGK